MGYGRIASWAPISSSPCCGPPAISTSTVGFSSCCSCCCSCSSCSSPRAITESSQVDEKGKTDTRRRARRYVARPGREMSTTCRCLALLGRAGSAAATPSPVTACRPLPSLIHSLRYLPTCLLACLPLSVCEDWFVYVGRDTQPLQACQPVEAQWGRGRAAPSWRRGVVRWPAESTCGLSSWWWTPRLWDARYVRAGRQAAHGRQAGNGRPGRAGRQAGRSSCSLDRRLHQ